MKQVKHAVIPIFIPHKGCPHDCIFCNQKSISGRQEEPSLQSMKDTIEAHLLSIGEDREIEIGFYGGSFTGIDKDLQLLYLSLASEYVKKGRVRALRLSTRPDYIDDDILTYLKAYHVKVIELGVQSLDPGVLLLSSRGHSSRDVWKAAAMIKDHGFQLGIQTMVGLPDDDFDKDIQTAKEVIRMAPAFVRIYPALVVKNTILEKLTLRGQYVPMTLEEAVHICAVLLKLYREAGIKVIRMGLQATESIHEGGDVVAGPFHPAFRQLVEARLLREDIEEQIHRRDLTGAASILIHSGMADISAIAGQGRENMEYFKKKYGYKAVKIKDTRSGGGTLWIDAIK